MSMRSASATYNNKNLSKLRAGGGARLCSFGALVLLCGFFAAPGAAAEAGRESAASVQETPASQQADPMYEALSNLHATQRWLEGEIGRLQDQLAESASGFTAIQQALRDKEAEVSGLKVRLVELERSNREAEEARRLVVAENSKLAAALSAQRANTGVGAQDLQGRLKALQQHLSAMELEGDERRSRCAELERGRDHALSANLIMQAEKRELEGELERHERARDELTRRIETLEVSLGAKGAEYGVLAEEKDKLEEALAQSASRVEDLTQELGGDREAQQREGMRIEQLIASETDLQARLAEQEQAAKAAQGRADAAEAKLADLKAASTALESRTEAFRDSLSESEDKADKIESQREARSAELAAAEAMNGTLVRENAELRDSLEKAREEAADTVQRLRVLEETHAGAVAALERLQKGKAELEADAQELAKAAPESGDKCPKAEAVTLAPRDQSECRVEECEERLQALEADKQQLTQEAVSLRNDLESLRALLPVTSGGTVTEEKMQQEAAKRADALRTLYRQRGQMEDAAWSAMRSKLEAELRERQFLLAQSMSAEGVYRVKRDDNLGKVSQKVYGKAGRWSEIFDANRHLLENPDRLFPGMTLVIP